MIRTTEIVTPATAVALTTLAALKDELQQADSAADDYLTRRILAASSSIATDTGRTFGRETVRDTFRPERVGLCATYDRRRVAPLVLSRDMLAGSVIVADAAGLPLDASTYYVDLGAGLVHRLTMGRYAAWGWAAVSVTYMTGWSLPGETGRNLPQIVEDVCIEMAAKGFHARGRDPGLRNEAAEGLGSIRYTDAPYAPDARLAPFVVHPR